jgi:predicted Zn-dependent protease with MMP-like domain
MRRAEFERIVDETLDALPDWVHEALDNIEILVIDEAGVDLDPEQQGLLGLYTGVPLPLRDSDYVAELPDVIYIFRRPHLELGLGGQELRDEIVTTLLHEIAHYFGIEDNHLDEIGWG